MEKWQAEKQEGKQSNEDDTKILKESTHTSLEIFLFHSRVWLSKMKTNKKPTILILGS
jgi:hypothetical protein